MVDVADLDLLVLAVSGSELDENFSEIEIWTSLDLMLYVRAEGLDIFFRVSQWRQNLLRCSHVDGYVVRVGLLADSALKRVYRDVRVADSLVLGGLGSHVFCVALEDGIGFFAGTGFLLFVGLVATAPAERGAQLAEEVHL